MHSIGFRPPGATLASGTDHALAGSTVLATILAEPGDKYPFAAGTMTRHPRPAARAGWWLPAHRPARSVDSVPGDGRYLVEHGWTEDAVKFGISYNTGYYGVDPDQIAAFARHAEDCGFESFYVPEHIVLYPGAMLGPIEIPPSLPI